MCSIQVLRIVLKKQITGLSEEKVERLMSAKRMIADLDRRKLPKVVHAFPFNPALHQEWLKVDEVKWRNDLIK